MRKTIISITVDHDVYHQLPKKGKSAFMNALAREHFARTINGEDLDETVENLLSSERFEQYVKRQVRDTIEEMRG